MDLKNTLLLHSSVSTSGFGLFDVQILLYWKGTVPWYSLQCVPKMVGTSQLRAEDFDWYVPIGMVKT